MPKVKKKGKKGTKKGTKKSKKKVIKKKEVGEKKSIYNIPEFFDPKIYTPMVELNIRLATPMSDLFNFTLEVPTTTRLEEIKRKIVQKHHGAIDNVIICLNRFEAGEAVDLNKRLCDVGITTAGECKLFYEYKPISHPLLGI
ncbi:unnamed protein product [Moneuplotes crassus]|uniref:Ubiquitin-like domain-containing protein n=1 Tax=Euplotes crassus TaxID=5936 RepID=A0AAD2D5R3_EUPCR|nr:unnamed protein product [Moneuplotes crassus]